MNSSPSPLAHKLKIDSSTTLVGAIGVALMVVGVFAFVFLNRSHVSSKDLYRPEGYIHRVKDLIETGRLVYRRADETTGGNKWGFIEFLEDPQHLPREKVKVQNSFYAESKRLQRDIEQFNQNGEGVFRIHRRRNKESKKIETAIRFDETSYNFYLPYPRRNTMDTKISSGGDELPTLGGENIALGFSALGEDVRLAGLSDIESLPLSEWFAPDPTNGSYRQALGYNLMGEADGTLISLRATETGTTLRVFASDRFRLFINGVSMQRPDGADAEAFIRNRREGLPDNTLRLDEGDRIRIRDLSAKHHEDEMIFRFGRFDGASLMQTWVENGKLVSQIDPKVARSLPFTQQLVNAINTYGSGKNLRPPKVELTVDQSLNSMLQTKLDTFVRKLDTSLVQNPHTEFEPACIAVVDALSGDVLAIPSYPSPADLEKLSQQFQTGRAPEDIGDSKISQLEWNQNFPTIPIGSTAKPILATAIWNTHPHLRKLTIHEPAGSIGSIFGLSLARPLKTSRHARTVDPVAFLGQSSNAYTVSLYLLTLARADSFSLDRNGFVNAVGGKVDFSRHIQGDLIPHGLLSEDLPAHNKLADFFDIDLNTDYLLGKTTPFDRSFISPVLQQLEIGDDDPLPAEFQRVTPARTILNLQEIDVVRGELVSMLVGGYTNRWSNLKLAEAYSRIGTGRKVQARLLRDTKAGKVPVFETMGDRQVLGLVHEGLTAAWKNGTAERLRRQVDRENALLAAEGLRLKFLAKTGTARREKYECAAVAFYAEIQNSSGKPLSALATTIYLQDRADSRGSAQNSAVAVELGAEVLPDLVHWLRRSPAVQNAPR